MRWCAWSRAKQAAGIGASARRSSCARCVPATPSPWYTSGCRMGRSASLSAAQASPSRTACWFAISMTHEPPEPIRAQWTGRPERGSALLARVMMSLSLGLGRPVARGILHLVAAYFFVFAPAARRHSRAYLRRALGREPTSSDRYRHVFTFAVTLLDRFYLTRERYDLLDISIEGEELVRPAFERCTGAFLLGPHLGGFELMSAVGRRQPGLRGALAMYT